jgi:hypothetical protein
MSSIGERRCLLSVLPLVPHARPFRALLSPSKSCSIDLSQLKHHSPFLPDYPSIVISSISPKMAGNPVPFADIAKPANDVSPESFALFSPPHLRPQANTSPALDQGLLPCPSWYLLPHKASLQVNLIISTSQPRGQVESS